MKKTIIFVMIICFIWGVGMVEQAYFTSTENKTSIIPQARRLDNKIVAISVFGYSHNLDVSFINNKINTIKYSMSEGIYTAISKIEEALGIEQYPSVELQFGVKSL